MADTGMFTSQSNLGYSLSPLIAKPIVADRTSQDIDNLLGVVSQSTEKLIQKYEIDQLSYKSKEYTEAKRRYTEDKENSLTSDDHKKAYTRFVQSTDGILGDTGLTEKNKATMMQWQQKDLDYLSSEYRGVVKAENKAFFKSATADVIAAGLSMEPEGKKELYKLFLDASNIYQVDRVEAAEEFSKSLANTVIASIDPRTATLQQVSTAKKDVLDVLGSDNHNTNKPYMQTISNTFDGITQKVQATKVDLLKAELANVTTSYNSKLGLIDAAVSDGIIINKDEATTLKQLAKNTHDATTRADAQQYAAAMGADMSQTEAEYAKVLSNPNLGMSAQDQETRLATFKISKQRHNTWVMSQSIDNIVNSPYISIVDKQATITKAMELETNEVAKVKLEGHRVAVEKQAEKERKEDIKNTIKDKQLSFAARVSYVVDNEPDEKKQNAVISSLITEEMRKFNAKDPMYRLDKAELDAFIKNPDKAIGEKAIAIDNAKHLTGTQKESILAQLYKKEAIAGAKEAKEVSKVFRAEAATAVNEIFTGAAQGIYDKTPAEVTTLTAMAFAGKTTPKEVFNALNDYSRQYDMYRNFNSGGDNRTDSRFDHISLTLPPNKANELASILSSAVDTNSLANAVNMYKQIERGKFIIPDKLREDATVASILLTTMPDVAVERFRAYSTSPVGGDKLKKDVKAVETAIADAWFSRNISRDGTAPYMGSLNKIATISLKAGLNKDETISLLEKEQDKYVDVSSMFGETKYIPKTSYLQTKGEYNNIASSFKASIGASSVEGMYPIDFTDAENSPMRVYYKDKSGIPMAQVITKDDIKLMLGKGKK